MCADYLMMLGCSFGNFHCNCIHSLHIAWSPSICWIFPKSYLCTVLLMSASAASSQAYTVCFVKQRCASGVEKVTPYSNDVLAPPDWRWRWQPFRAPPSGSHRCPVVSFLRFHWTSTVGITAVLVGIAAFPVFRAAGIAANFIYRIILWFCWTWFLFWFSLFPNKPLSIWKKIWRTVVVGFSGFHRFFQNASIFFLRSLRQCNKSSIMTGQLLCRPGSSVFIFCWDLSRTTYFSSSSSGRRSVSFILSRIGFCCPT